MSEPAVQAQRKPSANKNIKKLRTVSMVCSLAQSWQQWVRENEDKQASEPAGWAPDSCKSETDVSAKCLSEKKNQPSRKPKYQREDNGHTFENRESRIKTKQVSKTVTRDVQEKSAGIEYFTNRLCKDPGTEELDKMLNKKSSPTRRRKCFNMMSELKQSWKVVEQELKFVGQESTGSDGKVTALDLSSSENQEETKEKGTGSLSIHLMQPSVFGAKKVENTNKINDISCKFSAVGNLTSRWQNWASEHSTSQKLNPFSEVFDYEYSMSTRLRKGENGYGRPKEGSKTAERAKRAEAHIHREIEHMCFIIRTMATDNQDGKIRVTFGELFDRYVRISDKVVGILMRARKHGKVAFEGEMLWQGRDDKVIITLLE